MSTRLRPSPAAAHYNSQQAVRTATGPAPLCRLRGTTGNVVAAPRRHLTSDAGGRLPQLPWEPGAGLGSSN